MGITHGMHGFIAHGMHVFIAQGMHGFIAMHHWKLHGFVIPCRCNILAYAQRIETRHSFKRLSGNDTQGPQGGAIGP